MKKRQDWGQIYTARDVLELLEEKKPASMLIQDCTSIYGDKAPEGYVDLPAQVEKRIREIEAKATEIGAQYDCLQVTSELKDALREGTHDFGIITGAWMDRSDGLVVGSADAEWLVRDFQKEIGENVYVLLPEKETHSNRFNLSFLRLEQMYDITDLFVK